MENVICYACNCSQSASYASENGFVLVKCEQCGLLYVNPRPSADDVAESHKYGVHAGDIQFDVTGRFDTSKVTHYLDVLGDLYDGGSFKAETWLDIGCGHGEFLLALKKFSEGRVEPIGTEPNVKKQLSAQKHGLNVSWIDLDEHTIEYDVVSLLNVYSHLPNPVETLGKWKQLVKIGGEMVLETGDTANLSSVEHYRPFYLPDHLSFASEEIVTSIFQQIGFEIVTIQKYHVVKNDPKTIAKELIKLMLPSKQSRLKHLLIDREKYKTDMYIRARRVV